ncbi:MAG: hypothetical protein AUG16_03255 [Thaumarchaeota archaeon 13_1_20CM_2_39_20]|nr:MAG: hypothetical protein AUI59_02095 [Thaumarchaeota archaeon 13_1_40CM_2_39_13_1]OLE40654.1 MAG: hypothetical protein AUG16_03255 [Thaumarchaeota archaeon 13_1_20CM_2_39_20]
MKLDELQKELGLFVNLILNDSGKASRRYFTVGGGILGVKLSINTSPLVHDLQEGHNLPRYQIQQEDEPLVDVIGDKNTLKVMALLPGVKKEDVSYDVVDGMIKLKITKGGKAFYKEIPCDVNPSKISVLSTTINNSVLEIIFKKKI